MSYLSAKPREARSCHTGNEHRTRQSNEESERFSTKTPSGWMKTIVFRGAKAREERSCHTGNEHRTRQSNEESERFSPNTIRLDENDCL
ncbi:hypothetical protein, partial [Aureibacillus halotolerans]|uniref:hypothetical protein n=1 Tax=Aureibacillus halotolerans TaxID=1508390 RepID=UPI0014152540